MTHHGALGLIEVIGLTAALEAADTCLKSSNVQLIGYEKITSGQVTVKIHGDVGAVKAAIEAAKVSASKIGSVVSTLVIPRPATGILSFIYSPETISTDDEVNRAVELSDEKEDMTTPVIDQTITIEDQVGLAEETGEHSVHEIETPYPQVVMEETMETQPSDDIKSEHVQSEETEIIIDQHQSEEILEQEIGCNLCHDPNCMREKGQPRTQCIHYKGN